VPEFWNVGDVIDYLRRHADMPEEFYVIYVIDPKFHPVGYLTLSKILRHPRDNKLHELMETDMHPLRAEVDQEEVAYVFRKYGLVEAPVINEQGRMIGTITVDDVVHVMREEEEEDFMKSGGVSTKDMYDSVSSSVKRRFPWLFINLLTAIAASAVIDVYEDTIQQLVLLAVLMPIIASMGGNAGIQAATVAVRAIATRHVAAAGAFKMVRKEMMVGLLNGVGLAVITAVGIMIIYGNIQIAVIFAVATVITMIVAGLSGAGLPLIMERMKVDPAIASGVCLTMLTDIFGFFAFLGLASFILF
jgi:magnesium transporter